MKKKWERPKLIVLFRGKPEEGVLNGCKDGSSIPRSVVQPSSDDTKCMALDTVECTPCNAISS